MGQITTARKGEMLRTLFEIPPRSRRSWAGIQARWIECPMMSIERAFYCDGPDCERFARTTSTLPTGFLSVSEGADHASHFCGWDCVLRFAAEMPQEDVISAEIGG